MQKYPYTLYLKGFLQLPILQGVHMKRISRSLNLFAVVLLCSSAAHAKLSWNDAKDKIVSKADHVIKNYDKELCPTIMPVYEAITSKDNEEAWDIAKEVVESFQDTKIFKEACANPTDDILRSELIIQASMAGGQKVASAAGKDIMKIMALSMKTGAIIGIYFEVLRDDLKASAKS